MARESPRRSHGGIIRSSCLLLVAPLNPLTIARRQRHPRGGEHTVLPLPTGLPYPGNLQEPIGMTSGLPKD
jgi:hypothetical protein